MDRGLIDQIQKSNDIVDVIGSYIKIHRSGRNFKSICPFHNDTHPSMQINQQKQIFKCFACGKGGNVITFVKDYEKISFFEALKKLANRAGIVIEDKPKFKSKNTEKREQLILAYKLSKNFYVDNLKQFGGEPATYLKERGLSEKTIAEFELGYALDSFNGLKNHLLKESKIQTANLKISGLFASKNNSNYDLFRNRLMFPIHSHIGDVVAFGGRKLNDSDMGPKYVNSPTTELYEKGKEVYGLFKTKYEISKADFAIVVEGYMDFLRLYESDFKNSIAGLGTALTEDQVKLVGRYSQNFVLLYDGDTAGQKAAMKAGFIIQKNGFSAKIVQLPKNEDPDSFILKHGKEAFQEMIDNAISYFKFIQISDDLGKNKKEKIEYLKELIGEIDDRLNKELVMKEISETFVISESNFYSLLNSKKNKVKKINTDINKHSEERILIHYLIHHPEDFNVYKDELKSELFHSDFYRNLFESICKSKFFETKSLQNQASLLNYFEDKKDMVDLMSDLFFRNISKINIAETINALKIRKLRQELSDIDNMIINNPDDLTLLQNKSLLKQMYQTLSKKVVKKTLR